MRRCPRFHNRIGMLAITLLLAGCSGGRIGTVEGTLFVDGQPHGGFEVEFISLADGSSGMGASQADGMFQLMRGRGSREIPVGKYKVTVTPTPFVEGVPLPQVKLPPSSTDQRYADIIKEVRPGKNVIDVELKSVK